MQFDTSDFVYAAWSRIQRHALASRKPVLMFVAPSADAAAASLSLRRLLEATLVRVEVHFVSSLRTDVKALLAQQAALIRAGASLDSDDDDHDDDADPARAEAVRAVRAYQRRYMLLFVGCGAGADLGSIIDWEVAAEAHVLDSTRPVHLATLRAAAGSADFILADARRASAEGMEGGNAALALQPPPEGCALALWGYDEAAGDTTALLRVLARAERSRLRALRAAAAADRQQSKRMRREAKKRLRRGDAEAEETAHGHTAEASSNRSRRRALQRRRLEEEDEGPDAADANSNASVDRDDDAHSESDAELDDASMAMEEGEEDQSSSTDADSSDEDDESAPNWRYGVIPVALEARYYSAAFAGRSVAMLIYELSERLGQSHVDAVWCAAVGCADLFARGYCDAGTYDAEHQRLVAASKQVEASRRTTLVAEGALRDIGANVTSGGKHQHAALDAAGRHVQLVEEAHPRLFLLRPGTLWSALWYATPVAAALRLHHPERGAEQLRSLLARVGVSVDAARAPWMALPAGRRSAILRDLRAALHGAGVPGLSRDITTPCLARSTGYAHPVTAFDACEVFYACVAAHPGIRDDAHRGGGGTGPNPNAGGAAARQAAYRAACRTRFDVGVAALMDAPDGRVFRIAVDEAHQLREAVAEATAALMQRGALRATAHALVGTIGRTQGAAARAAFWDPPRLSALARHLAFTAAVSDPSATAAAAQAAAGASAQQAAAGWRRFAARPLVLACAAPEGAEEMLGGGASVAIVYVQAPFGARDAAAGRSGAMVERPGVRVFATTAAETGAASLADALPERGGVRLAVGSLHDGICGAVADARVVVAASNDAASQIVDVCALGDVTL